jgi:hypothetical protein
MSMRIHSGLKGVCSLAVILLTVCCLVTAFQSPARAASKIPIELDIDTSGNAAGDFGQLIERYIRTTDFYVLDKKKNPRVGVSVNAISKGDNPLVTYSIVLTVTTGKCPQAFVGTIFGDNSGEEPKALHMKLEKAVMAIAKEFNL